MSGHDQLQSLFDEDWTWELLDNPEFASFSGFHDVKHVAGMELQDVSDAAYKNRALHSKDMLNKLAAIKSQHELTGHDATFAALFETMHEDLKEAVQKHPLYLLPLNSIGAGCVMRSFTESIEWMRFETLGDFEGYALKLKAFHRQVDDNISSMREGMRLGYVASKPILKNVEKQLLDIIASDLDEMKAPLLSTVGKELATQHETVFTQISELILATKAAYQKFLDFFKAEYYPAAPETAGCTSLPNSVELYAQCLKFHTTTSLTADEIHEIGLKEVALIEERFRVDVLTPLGFDPDNFPAFVAHVNSDPKFYVETEEALLDVYRNLCAEIQTLLPEYFSEFPKSDVEITSNVSGGPAAFYLAGTPDGKRPGRFYVNVSHLDKRPTYEAVALALHEAIPGHHHQAGLCIENEALPNWFRFLEDRRYEVAPCRRNMYTGYLEGWALYCEYLGEEMGMYRTPYDMFGRLSMDMMRAVRLVVDTGIHSKGWTVGQAIDYMKEKTGMHQHEVEAEVYRYAAWPGQACAYKIGQLEILRLRKRAEAALGAQFSIKRFHSVCLMSGSLPLSLLQVKVDEYVSSVLGGEGGGGGGGVSSVMWLVAVVGVVGSVGGWVGGHDVRAFVIFLLREEDVPSDLFHRFTTGGCCTTSYNN